MLRWTARTSGASVVDEKTWSVEQLQACIRAFVVRDKLARLRVLKCELPSDAPLDDPSGTIRYDNCPCQLSLSRRCHPLLCLLPCLLQPLLLSTDMPGRRCCASS